MQRLIDNRGEIMLSLAPQTMGSDCAMPVLIAEDDPDDRLMAVDAFEECHFDQPLAFVDDGEDLMDYLLHRGRYSDVRQFPLPRLILLDLNMPRMDGREALREIKSSHALKHIPVVVLSTSDALEDITRCYRDGVNSYIAKPASFQGLVEVMRSLGHYWLKTVDLPLPRRVRRS